MAIKGYFRRHRQPLEADSTASTLVPSLVVTPPPLAQLRADVEANFDSPRVCFSGCAHRPTKALRCDAVHGSSGCIGGSHSTLQWDAQ